MNFQGLNQCDTLRTPFNVATPSRSRGRFNSGLGDRHFAAQRSPASALDNLMRQKGVDEAWAALEDMQQRGVTTDKFTISRMLMKTVGDGRSRLNTNAVYRGIALVEKFIELQPNDVDEVLFNALLDTCCRLKDLNRLENIMKRMRELKVTPSPVTLGILVKTYGQAGDIQKVLQVWSEMEKQRAQANSVTYGCMIDACVKCGHLEKAIEIFLGMKQENKHRNTILYTTLIKGHGHERDLKTALELFAEMKREGVPYNTITYNSIIDVCIKCGDVPMAESLLRQMTSPESPTAPDLITFSTLLKGYCHSEEIDKALRVAEAIKRRGFRCDELVYNTLMDGCVKANDVFAGIGLFEEMVQNGMRPSSITHSIVARLYQRAGFEENTVEAVAVLYQYHGLEAPSSKSLWRRNGSWRNASDSTAAGGSGITFSNHHGRSGTSVPMSGEWGGVPTLPGYQECPSSTDCSTTAMPCNMVQQSRPDFTNPPYLPIEMVGGMMHAFQSFDSHSNLCNVNVAGCPAATCDVTFGNPSFAMAQSPTTSANGFPVDMIASGISSPMPVGGSPFHMNIVPQVPALPFQCAAPSNGSKSESVSPGFGAPGCHLSAHCPAVGGWSCGTFNSDGSNQSPAQQLFVMQAPVPMSAFDVTARGGRNNDAPLPCAHGVDQQHIASLGPMLNGPGMGTTPSRVQNAGGWLDACVTEPCKETVGVVMPPSIPGGLDCAPACTSMPSRFGA